MGNSKGENRSIPIIDLLIINIPVLLFLTGAILGSYLAFLHASHLRIALFFISWWCVCGAFMLSYDFITRKISQYHRLLNLVSAKSWNKKLVGGLMTTVCGFCMLLALKRRLGAASK